MDRRDEELIACANVAAIAERDYNDFLIKKAEQERKTRGKR